jgi:hypothetical protein
VLVDTDMVKKLAALDIDVETLIIAGLVANGAVVTSVRATGDAVSSVSVNA